ncbi:hypothetical protein OKW40_004384 [Paraburkholderia sp. RAU6.4a]|uniref:hypothetical protein n=1 Tax=Paraburkholderia sp. RAU6.4a TaxID=2991067 RepID=UPI003D1F29A1
MGYRDDLYVKGNIIGWTGDIDGDAFSVYFADCGGAQPKTVRIADVDQVVVQFGHITQKHDCPYNIGREEVDECFSYAIYNSDGAMRESVLGKPGKYKLARGKSIKDKDYAVFHTSRSSFNRVTKGSIARLASVIAIFPNIKTRYTTDRQKFEEWLRG